MYSHMKKVLCTVLVTMGFVSVVFGTEYEYDSLNRLSMVTYENHVQIAYSYDDSGNQTGRVISLKPDITNDGYVERLDLIELAAMWLEEPCIHPDWCWSADLDLSGQVNLKDFSILADHWLEGMIFVPNVVGMSQTDAEAAILDAGLVIGTVTEVYSDTIVAGNVISQNYAVRPGDGVNLVVSKGPEPQIWVEDFETGDFTNHPWQHLGNAQWVVVSDIKYEGTYASKSGTITHNQTTTLEITLDTPFETISFYHKVSSEGNWDFLRFYIDGVQQATWSGNQDWAQQTYSITPGVRTFRWSYTKDGSVNSGSDCAWIDNITLY